MRSWWRSVQNWLRVNLDEEGAGTSQTISVLDGVRGVAILLVIFFHMNHVLLPTVWTGKEHPLTSSVATAGSSGVTLFFALSGCLLFLPYARFMLFDRRRPLTRVFYLRRTLRIMPGYYLSLLVLILITSRQYLQPAYLKQTIFFLTFFMDSTSQTFRQLNGPYWTLALEWQFYLILPWLALGFAWLVRRFSRSYRLLLAALCLLGMVGYALLMRWIGLHYTAYPNATLLVSRHTLNWILFFTYGFTGKYTEDFALGMLVALFYVAAQGTNGPLLPRLQRLSLWSWGAGLLILLFMAMWNDHVAYDNWSFLNNTGHLFQEYSETGFALGYALCMLAILTGPPVLQTIFNFSWLRWTGKISYSLYIWHLPLIYLCRDEILDHIANLNPFLRYGLVWLWVLLVIFPVCLCIYLLVERPFIRLSDCWRKGIEKNSRAKKELLKQDNGASESLQIEPEAIEVEEARI